MFRFAHPYLLWGLLLIPVFIFIFWLYLRWKQKALKSFGEPELISRLMPDTSKSRPIIRFILLMIAFIFLIFGLADPQIGSKLEKAKRKGADIMLCLDISNSMLAEDIKPGRLERAKYAISKLIDKLEDDRIGIVVFGGQAFVQLPITSDHSAAKMFTSTISTNIMPVQGTAIGSAIDLAQESFMENSLKNKAIIIISDGENHEDDPVGAAAKAAEKGIRIFTVGVGSPEGVPIPVPETQNQFLKDNSGSTVVTKLDELTLQQIAAAGNGIYIRASYAEIGLNNIFNEISKMEKKEYESRIFSEYEDRFQYFIGAALLFFLLEIFIFERRNKLFSRFNPFNKQSLLSFNKE
jgi:Ca-activated chloride channel family protein